MPYRTLGLPAEAARDGWHRPLTYRVHGVLADPATLTTRGDYCGATPSAAGLVVDGGGGEVPAFVLVSHGGNGNGAFVQSGGRIAGAGGDEVENADADEAFVTTGSAGPGAEFDDIVQWVGQHALVTYLGNEACP